MKVIIVPVRKEGPRGDRDPNKHPYLDYEIHLLGPDEKPSTTSLVHIVDGFDNWWTTIKPEAEVRKEAEEYGQRLARQSRGELVWADDAKPVSDSIKALLFDILHPGGLEELEWSGTREGQGDGPHSSGPGPLFAACPVCGGLKEPNGHFIAEAVGHRPDCQLARLLKEVRDDTRGP